MQSQLLCKTCNKYYFRNLSGCPRCINNCNTCYIPIPGPQGFTGATGIQGFNGATGSGGGDPGATGFQGSTGLQGFIGSTGLQGNDGSTGLQGFIGSTGLQGFIGSTGIQGSTGITGATGTVTQSFGTFYLDSGVPGQTLVPATSNVSNNLQFVSFTNTGPIVNMTYVTNGINNMIGVNLGNSGTYLANYSVNVTTPNATNAIALYNLSSGVESVIPGSVVVSGSDRIVGSVEFTAQANDFINLSNGNNTNNLSIYNSLNIIGNTSVTGTSVSTLETVNAIIITSTPVTNSIYVSIHWTGTATISSVADTLSGLYTFVNTASINSINTSVYYRDNSVAGSLKVTVTLSSTVSVLLMEVLVLGNTTTPSMISNNTGEGILTQISTITSVSLSPQENQIMYLTGYYSPNAGVIIPLINNVVIVNQEVGTDLGFDALRVAQKSGPQLASMQVIVSPIPSNYTLVGIVIGYISPFIVPPISASLSLTQIQ
jgi:hypothetical protein